MSQNDKAYVYIDSLNKKIEARISCFFSQKGKWHFAECPELDLIDQGHSQREAFDHLVEMIIVTLIEAIEAGKLDEMMRELGFVKKRIPKANQARFEPKTKPSGIPLEIKKPLESPWTSASLAAAM